MKDFKIGDRVRVKATPNPEWMPKMPPCPDAIFKVDDIQNDKLILSVKSSDAVFICDAKHFELVETPDQPKNMTDMSFEPISEAEAYIVNQAFGDSYIRVSDKCLDIKGELKEADPKTAFLSELQSLLRRYNAYIFPCGYEVDGLSIVINDKDEIHYDMYEWSTMHDLSADNIFNYDK